MFLADPRLRVHADQQHLLHAGVHLSTEQVVVLIVAVDHMDSLALSSSKVIQPGNRTHTASAGAEHVEHDLGCPRQGWTILFVHFPEEIGLGEELQGRELATCPSHTRITSYHSSNFY